MSLVTYKLTSPIKTITAEQDSFVARCLRSRTTKLRNETVQTDSSFYNVIFIALVQRSVRAKRTGSLRWTHVCLQHLVTHCCCGSSLKRTPCKWSRTVSYEWNWRNIFAEIFSGAERWWAIPCILEDLCIFRKYIFLKK